MQSILLSERGLLFCIGKKREKNACKMCIYGKREKYVHINSTLQCILCLSVSEGGGRGADYEAGDEIETDLDLFEFLVCGNIKRNIFY